MTYVASTECRLPFREGVRQRLSMTARLSHLSDWMCGPLVMRAARRYSNAICTPNHFVEMLFLVEDKRFSVHFGIDPIAVARAIDFNLRHKSLQGASTIAQQIVTIRMARTKPVSRSITYKLAQIVQAVSESALRSKASILEEYVETVYWGRSYHGLDRAAEGYFNADRKSLSVAQSFFLAERIAAPNRVSAKRISNLLERPPITMNIARNGATIVEVLKVYEQVYGKGGKAWPLLEK